MGGGPSLSRAALISTCLEAIFYGFSVFMFGLTLWILYAHRATAHVNRVMFFCSCTFFIFTTLHMVIDTIRVVQGFVIHRNDVPLGTEGFFADLRQYTFVVKNIVYLITATFGDAVVIYRCYMVWQRWWILLFPGVMITGTSAAGIAAMYYIVTFSVTDPTSYGHIQTWITVFYAMTLSTNFLCTAVLAFRIWSVNNQVKQYRLGAHVPVLMIIIDSGLTYAVVHFVILICWAIQNTLNYVFLDMAMPIIAISFYMVIVRISLAKSTSEHVKATLAGEVTTMGLHTDDYPMRPLEVHIAQLTERDDPHGTVETKNQQELSYERYEHDVERGSRDGAAFDAESDPVKARAV